MLYGPKAGTRVGNYRVRNLDGAQKSWEARAAPQVHVVWSTPSIGRGLAIRAERKGGFAKALVVLARSYLDVFVAASVKAGVRLKATTLYCFVLVAPEKAGVTATLPTHATHSSDRGAERVKDATRVFHSSRIKHNGGI